MVRGTNKMIIEVNDVENQYFEKVILFVKDNHITRSGQSLEEQANQYIATMKNGNKIGFLRAKRYIALAQMALAGVGGAILTLLLMSM